MTTSDAAIALDLVRERWKKMLPVETTKARLASWEPPYFVRGLGIVANFHLYDAETFQGPSGDLVVVPIARMDEASAVVDELQTRLDALKDDLAKALDQPLEKTLGLKRPEVFAGMFEADEETVQRRRDALALMYERFPAVVTRMKEVYGLRLPKYMATLAAFWRSLDDVERKGMECLGCKPGGIMVWFEDRGLERKTRDNLDPRLECRFRADPPELVTFMWGNGDGLHYGLWYDDPADPPTYIAHNYARDSAETWPDEEYTPIMLLLAHARKCIREEEPALAVHAILATLEWFIDADRKTRVADAPVKRWLEADRIPTLGTFGPALPPGSGTIRVGNAEARLNAWKEQPDRVKKWIDSAKRDCAAGKPAAALTFGLDLHWLDMDVYRQQSLDLLLAAYEKLGRRAHAETLKIHHAHRDLASVGVFLDEDEGQNQSDKE